MDALLADPAYDTVHATTQRDDWLATAATIKMADDLVAQLPPPPPPAMGQGGASDPAASADDAEGHAAGAAPGDSSTPMPPLAPGARAAIHAALQAGDAAAEDLQTALAAWGTSPGALEHLPLDDRLRLGEQLTTTPRLRQISRWLGRMQRATRGWKSRRVEPQHDELFRLTRGQDLAHALAADLGLWARPDTAPLAQVRYVQHQLLQYGFRGRDRVALGPVIALVDLSGSTAGDVEVWEKAVAIALTLEAARTHRPVRLVAFSSGVDPLIWDFDASESVPHRLPQLLTFATTWLGGGTDWDTPMRHALAALQHTTWGAADILFLTDGKAALDPDTVDALQAARARGLRTVTALVGADALARHEAVAPWSTQVLHVTPGLDDAAHLLTAIDTPAQPRRGSA
jgi:Mg-chelatase subunit ChlD